MILLIFRNIYFISLEDLSTLHISPQHKPPPLSLTYSHIYFSDYKSSRIRFINLSTLSSIGITLYSQNVGLFLPSTAAAQLYRRWGWGQDVRFKRIRRFVTIHGLFAFYHGKYKDRIESLMGPLLRGVPINDHRRARIVNRV